MLMLNWFSSACIVLALHAGSLFVNTNNTSLVKDRDIIGGKNETVGSRQSMLKAEQKPKQRL